MADEHGNVFDPDAALAKAARDLARRAAAVARVPREEAIHDARVAANKLRLMLGLEFGRGLPARRQMLGDLRRLKRALAPARDADVALARFRELGPPPKEASETARAIARELAAERQRAGKEIASAAGRSRFARMLGSAEKLRRAAGERARRAERKAKSGADGGERAVAARIADEIARRHKKFEARRAGILADFSAEALHRLRISGKGLRYLFGIFGAARPEVYGPLRALLDEFHDCLGELHDLDVLERRIATICWRQAARGPAPREGAQAAREWALRRTVERRAPLMRQFLEIWLRLDAPPTRALWKQAQSRPAKQAPSRKRGPAAPTE